MLVLVAVAALAPGVRAEKLPVRTFTMEDGLPGNRVNSLFQDSRGFLWAGTDSGLARFDGHRFEVFGIEAGLPSGFVTGIGELTDGSLVIATSKGLVRMRPDSAEPATAGAKPRTVLERIPAPGKANPLWISGLFPDRDGTILCASQEGLLRYDGDTLQPVPLPIRPDKEGDTTVFHGLRDPEGRLWLGAGTGLYRVSPGGTVDRFDRSNGLPDTAVVRLYRAKGGRLFAATPSGAVELRPDARAGESIVARSFADEDPAARTWVTDFVETWDGEIWMSGHTGLLVLPPPGGDGDGAIRFLTSRNGFPEGQLISLLEDRDGVLWVGGEASGAIRVIRNSLVRFDQDDGLSVVRAGAFTEPADGEILVSGTVGPGRELDRFDGRRFHPIRPRMPPGAAHFGWGWKQTECRDLAGRWWIAAGEAVLGWLASVPVEEIGRRPADVVLRPGRELPGNDVFRLWADRRGDLWISLTGDVENVIVRRDAATGKLVRYGKEAGIPRAAPTAFAEGVDGTLFIGFYDGSLVRRSGERFEPIGPERGPTGGFVSDLRVAADGSLWLATFRGLAHVEAPTSEKPRTVVFGENEGLASTGASSVEEVGDGRLLVGSSRGLDLFDPEKRTSLHYGVAEGLPNSAVVAIHRDRKGFFWIGTILGVARLRLGPALPRAPLRVFLESIRVAGAPVPLSPIGQPRLPARRLDPSENRVEIEYIAPTSGLDQGVRYQYRLVGASDSWSPPTADRSIRFAHLAPGNYRFEVRAITSTGQVSLEPAIFPFVLPPPFWQRRPVILALLASALAATILLVRLRLAAARSESLRLERIVGERTEDLRQAKLALEEANRDLEGRVERGIEKLREAERFAAWGRLVTTVAHEIRHPIFAIRSVAWYLTERFGGDAEAAPHFRTIDREADRMTALMDELLEFARPAPPSGSPPTFRTCSPTRSRSTAPSTTRRSSRSPSSRRRGSRRFRSTGRSCSASS